MTLPHMSQYHQKRVKWIKKQVIQGKPPEDPGHKEWKAAFEAQKELANKKKLKPKGEHRQDSEDADSNIEPGPEDWDYEFWKIQVDEAEADPTALKKRKGKILAKNFLKDL